MDSAIGSCGIHNSCNDNIEEDCSTSFRRNNPSVGLQQPTSNRVLIHCANGSNRSATVTMALMMHRQGKINYTCKAYNTSSPGNFLFQTVLLPHPLDLSIEFLGDDASC